MRRDTAAPSFWDSAFRDPFRHEAPAALCLAIVWLFHLVSSCPILFHLAWSCQILLASSLVSGLASRICEIRRFCKICFKNLIQIQKKKKNTNWIPYWSKTMPGSAWGRSSKQVGSSNPKKRGAPMFFGPFWRKSADLGCRLGPLGAKWRHKESKTGSDIN